MAGEATPGEAGAGDIPGNFLPNFIFGMKRGVGTEKPAEAFGVGSTIEGVGVGKFPGVGVAGEVEIGLITSWGSFSEIWVSTIGSLAGGLPS